MSIDIQLTITPTDWEKLRCTVCKGYLSCAPIRIMPDGNNICGRCSPMDNDVLTYRQLTLEAMLSKATFLCRFKQYGCTTRILFNETGDHEAQCTHRSVPCAAAPFTACLWEGPVAQVLRHFAREHLEFLKQVAEFKLDVTQDAHGIFVVVQDEGSYEVKYAYDGSTASLRYDVQHFVFNAEDVSCKIRLTSAVEQDYTVQVKGSNCAVYNKDFFDTQSGVTLDITKFLEILNNPSSITVTFDVAGKGCVALEKLAINHTLLELLNKCKKCNYYLVPPIFDYREDIICLDCSYKCSGCKPSANKELQTVLAEQNYPCRWKDCTFISKGETIRAHEVKCEFRIHSCPFSDCKVHFTQATAAEHLDTHNCKMFLDKLTFEVCRTGSTLNYASTFIQNEVVLITSEVSHFFINLVHKLSVTDTSKSNPSNLKINWFFTHDHCSQKLDKFSFMRYEKGTIFRNLPKCFRNTKLFLSIEVEQEVV